jgi:hypothetical protein
MQGEKRCQEPNSVLDTFTSWPRSPTSQLGLSPPVVCDIFTELILGFSTRKEPRLVLGSRMPRAKSARAARFAQGGSLASNFPAHMCRASRAASASAPGARSREFRDERHPPERGNYVAKNRVSRHNYDKMSWWQAPSTAWQSGVSRRGAELAEPEDKFTHVPYFSSASSAPLREYLSVNRVGRFWLLRTSARSARSADNFETALTCERTSRRTST